MAKHLEDFDNGYWSKYNCTSVVASPFYHRLHIALLKVLYEMTGEAAFGHYSKKWLGYHGKLLNKAKAFIVKAVQKLFEMDHTVGAFSDSEIKVMQIMPEFRLAGAEIMVENLAAALEEHNISACVVSLYKERTAITDRLAEKNIPVFYLGKKRGPDLRAAYRLYKLFRKERPTVVHTHRYVLPYAGPAAMLAGVPVRVHTIHNIANKEVGTLRRKLNRFFYRHCHVIPVAISPRIKQTVTQEYALAEDEVPMVCNGIDLKKITTKNSYDITGDSINLLHIGRFSEQKNHDGLIDAFKIIHEQVPKARLRLIGTGSLVSGIKEKVEALGLRDCVDFLGIKPDVCSYLFDADILLLPSLWEGMPITLIEAMAAGLPIVAASVGGVPDMITHGKTGLLVDTTKEKLAKAVITLIRAVSYTHLRAHET